MNTGPVTAATPAPEHGSPGTPDGRTCSAADAATPGQAARAELEATVRTTIATARDHDELCTFCENWVAAVMELADAYAAAALAAREPHAADGDAPATVDQAVKEWLDRRTATALATAPGIDDCEQGKRQGIDDLRQRLDDYWYTLTPAILAALGEREPAPDLDAAMAEAASRELAEAMRESRRFRDALQQVARHIDGDSTQARILARIAKRALEGK